MKRLFLLILLPVFSIIPETGYSQLYAEFISGYYITLDKDTVKADIYFEDWAISPSLISVRLPGENQKRNFRSKEIAGFGIKNSSMKADFISIQISIKHIQFPDKVVRFGKSPYSETQEISVFAKNMIKGEHASLYRIVDKYNKERYLFSKQGNITELENFTYLTQKEGSGQIYKFEYDNYRPQLISLCSDAPKIKNKTVTYDEQSLKNYILEYNRCFTGEIIEVYKPEHSAYQLLGGLGVLSLRNQGDLPTKTYPRVELGIRIHFPYRFRNSYIDLSYNLTAAIHKDFHPFTGVNVSYGHLIKSRGKFNAGYTLGFAEGYFFQIGLGIFYKKKVSIEAKYSGTKSIMLKYAFGK
jgi:hypothetical protein